MTVRKILINNQIIDITGVGYEPKGDLQIESGLDNINKEHIKLFMYGLLLCNDSELKEKEGKWRIRGDPTEGSLIVAAAKAGYEHNEIKIKYPRVNEFPFSSERKRMTTIHSTDDGDYLLFMKGACEVVLDKCKFTYSTDKIENLTENQRNEILTTNNQMAQEALRVLAVAYKKIPPSNTYLDGESLELDLVFLGLVGMIDPPRKEAIEAVKICKQVKIKPIMITGDHKLTAVSIAKEIGIYHEGDTALIGDDIEKMDDEEFEQSVENVTV
jgi:Ca2+-transporting ATPase